MEASQTDFELDTMPLCVDWTFDCSPQASLLLVVTLVTYLLRVLHKVTVKGKFFTVPGIDVGQTHSGSLEGIPMIMCGSLH